MPSTSLLDERSGKEHITLLIEFNIQVRCLLNFAEIQYFLSVNNC